MEALISPAELKEYLGCNDRTLYDLLKRDDFPSFRIGRRWYIYKDQFKEWTMEQK